MNEYREIATQKMRLFCEKVFASYGFNAEESIIITDVLLRADLYGIESHGVQRLIRYHNEIKTGLVDVHGKPKIIHETPISAVMDANKAMGQLAGVKAMKLAIKKAKTSGCGMVSVRNSNHYGIAGYYSNMAVEDDLMGICMTNSEAIGVPTFGRLAMIGTNPIAFAIPADPVTFSYDAATTVVPRGKLEVYNKSGKVLPEQWALDAAGRPCTNANEVLQNIIHKSGGGIAPLGGVGELFGGHKGYGLGAIVDIFTALLSGGLTSNHVNISPGVNGICHYFMAVNYGIFGDKAEIKKNVSTFLHELRNSGKAEGQERIYTHGEKEVEMMTLRKDGAIPVNEKTFKEFMDIALSQNVAWE
jgi:LDH2 family malate/lactate/ureidoglycolate dehydrogenase